MMGAYIFPHLPAAAHYAMLFLFKIDYPYTGEFAMALTGDLSQLHIADIIQLIHTTRKSGTLSVAGERGESRIIFSNGYLVSASHLNNRVRIGTVLVKQNALATKDLKQALDFQKKAGKDRKPLLKTLIQMGKISDDAAFKGLRKLIEITMVELISWTRGNFSFDDTAIAVSSEVTYNPGDMDQEMSLDAQMVLMDALRVFDERERDRQAGREVPADEDLFADVLPEEKAVPVPKKTTAITADLLGLADLDQLENRIPEPVSVEEIFDPVEIHRQKIREILADFPAEQQEAFVTFLRNATDRISRPAGPAQQEGQGRAVILFSSDKLLTHAAMTICKNDGILVFATEQEEEFDRIISQCQAMKVMPSLVFDTPGNSGCGLDKSNLTALHLRARGRHPQVPMFQLAAPEDITLMLLSFRDGMRGVLPKPQRDSRDFVAGMITFLEAFRVFARGFLHETSVFSEALAMRKLRDSMASLRDQEQLSDISQKVLQSVSQLFERSISFVVHPDELRGDRSVGVYAEKYEGLVSASSLKIPLSSYSVFRDVIEGGQAFFGESEDDVLREQLFEEIGVPHKLTVLLLPLKSLGQVRAVIYADFGKKDLAPVPLEMIEIVAQHAGLVLENALYRSQILKKKKT